jgi:hypothetical protein
MLDLLIATDSVRRGIQESLDSKPARARTRKSVRRRRAVVRSTSASVLRGLANLLEPSPTT